METYEVVILSEARVDIENIANYIINNYKNEELAFALIIELWAKIRTLDFMPDRYSVDEEPALKMRNIRHIRYKQYAIYYTIDEENKKVKVIRVKHTLQDLKKFFNI